MKVFRKTIEKDVDLEDSGKYPIAISKVMLSYLCLWPLNSSFVILFIRYFVLINTILMGIPHVYYMLSNITDMAVMASTCTTVSTTIQTAAKISLISYYSKDLSFILKTISRDFWPANVVDKSTEDSIKKNSRLIVTFLCIYLSTAFISCWDFMAIHLVFGRRILPLESSFPFDWTKSPWFEIIYIWQFIICIFTVIHTIAAHDFFFNALLMNCITQFKLLHGTLLTIGTGEDKIINKKLPTLPSFHPNYTFDDDEEFELVAKCVEQHNLVLMICEKLQKIYGSMILLQFTISATALCVSSFVLTQFENYASKMLSFSTAHLVQFFFLCTVGNELIWRSEDVSNGAYSSNWASRSSLRVQKALVLIIQRAQRPQVITALGFANLDYPNFINILRLSFSFYTLLSSIEFEE